MEMARRKLKARRQISRRPSLFTRRSKPRPTDRCCFHELLEARNVLAGDLIITGIIDGPLAGGTPKAIELYAAAAIPDLGVYGIGSANNGGGTDGVEFTLSGSASQGQHLYVASEATNFEAFFGFAPEFESSAVNVNGDDAIELFFDSNADGFVSPDLAVDDIVVDVFGEIAVDGSGQSWDYMDGWAYRVTSAEASELFTVDDWTSAGPIRLMTA